MRKKSLCILALVCLLLLAGCSGKPLPEGMEEDRLLEKGREIVQQLQETTSPADIQSYMEALLAEAGAYQKETDQMTTGQKLKDSGEEYATAVFYVKHEKDDMLYRIAFSTELELIGFQVSVR